MSRISHGSKNPSLLYVTGISRTFVLKIKTYVMHVTCPKLQHVTYVTHVVGHMGPKIQAFYMSRMCHTCHRGLGGGIAVWVMPK